MSFDEGVSYYLNRCERALRMLDTMNHAFCIGIKMKQSVLILGLLCIIINQYPDNHPIHAHVCACVARIVNARASTYACACGVCNASLTSSHDIFILRHPGRVSLVLLRLHST